MDYQIVTTFLYDAPFFLDAVDTQGMIVFWNNTAATLSGYSEADIREFDDPWAVLYPDLRYREKLFAMASKKNWNLAGEHVVLTAKNGSELVLRLSIIPIQTLLRDRNAERLAVGIPEKTGFKLLSNALKKSFNMSGIEFVPSGMSVPSTAEELSAFIAQRLRELDFFLKQP